MNTRFYNARILLKNLSIITGELHVKDNRISYIGDKPEITDGFDASINLNGNLIIPGFKNAHTHSPMTFLRSYADDLPLKEWLNNRVFPMEAKLNSDHIYTFTKLALLEYISGGTTSCFEMYFSIDDIAAACNEFGFRTVFCGAVNDFSESTDKIKDYYKRYNAPDSLLSFKIGFHAEYTTSYELLKELADFALECKAPVYAHNSETESEVKSCIEKYGMSPTALFDSLGMFKYGGGGFHCTYFDDNDMDIFKRKKLWVVTNPASNLKLASGIAPITKMLDKGLNVAIGTDGPASNNSLNMFKEMFLAAALQKYRLNDAAACPADKILNMAVSGGAGAMELKDCDYLDVGKYADLTVIDLNMPNMQPLNNIAKNIVYSGSVSNITLTMINGKILYKDGQFLLNEDIEKLYSDANKYMLDFL